MPVQPVPSVDTLDGSDYFGTGRYFQHGFVSRNTGRYPYPGYIIVLVHHGFLSDYHDFDNFLNCNFEITASNCHSAIGTISVLVSGNFGSCRESRYYFPNTQNYCPDIQIYFPDIPNLVAGLYGI